MTSLITGTWALVSSSVEIVKSTRRMTLRIRGLLQGGQLELSESDQCRLLGLQKRVACLVQPLNFLIIWSKQRDSCVQQVVLSAQELLFDVCSFIERFVPPESSPTGGPGGRTAGPSSSSGTIDSEKLEYYVRELEFACASVSMAVSIARVTEPALQLQQQAPVQGQGLGQSGSRGQEGVSLSALLRASRRIQEMHGRSGDLCTCPGRLYAEAIAAGGSAGSAEGAGSGSGNGSGSAGPSAQPQLQAQRQLAEWQPVLSLATFKVVAAVDDRLHRRRYRISVASRLPLSQPGRGHQEPRLASLEDVRDDFLAAHSGLNTSGPLDFPVDVALDASLVTTGSVALPAEPTQSSLDVAVDSLALVWSGSPYGGTFLPAGDDSPSDVTDAVLLPEAVATESVRPLCLGRRAGGRYAFIFDGQRGEAERAGEAEVALTPLDASYLARLCALDDGHHQPEVAAACPPHLLSSDEVLTALLLPDPEGPAAGIQGSAGPRA